jgi:hypothetical protein
METAIQIVWWIGLVGALVATLAILKEVALVLRTLGDIHKLAGYTLEAAQGITKHLEPIPGLAGLGEPVQRLDATAGEIVTVIEKIERRLGSLTAGYSQAGD